MRDIFTLPNLHEVVKIATLEQWEQVREDYLSLCQLCSEFGELATSAGTPPFPEILLTNLTIMGTRWLIAPLLSARYRGYGQWINMAFDKIHEGLTDPSFRTQVLDKQKARRTIETDVGYIEKPELSISE